MLESFASLDTAKRWAAIVGAAIDAEEAERREAEIEAAQKQYEQETGFRLPR